MKNTDWSVGVPDDQVTTEIDATGYLDAKRAAMRAHETQITVDGDYFALSNEIGPRILGREYYTRLAGPRADGDQGPRPKKTATPATCSPAEIGSLLNYGDIARPRRPPGNGRSRPLATWCCSCSAPSRA